MKNKIKLFFFLLAICSCKPADNNNAISDNSNERTNTPEVENLNVSKFHIDDEITSKNFNVSLIQDIKNKVFRFDLFDDSLLNDSLIINGINGYSILAHYSTFFEIELEMLGSGSIMKKQALIFIRNGKILVAYYGNSMMASNVMVLTKSNIEMHEETFRRTIFFYNQTLMPHGGAHLMKYRREEEVDINSGLVRVDSTSQFIELKRDTISGVYYEKMQSAQELGITYAADNDILIPVIEDDRVKYIYLNNKWCIMKDRGRLIDIF
jgi:hypothetical protein